jgi:phage protein D
MEAELSIFKVIINQKDVTLDISNDLLEFTYKDKTGGEPDELDIVLDNSSGKYRGSWSIDKGTTLSGEIGYNGRVINCGTFKVDEVETSGPPSIVRVRSLATSYQSKLRSKRSTAHENKTLREILNTIASDNDLELDDGSRYTQGRIDMKYESGLLYKSRAVLHKFIKEKDYKNGTRSGVTWANNMVIIREAAQGKGFPEIVASSEQIILLINRISKAGTIDNMIYLYQSGIGMFNSFQSQLDKANRVTNKASNVDPNLDKIRINRATQNNMSDIEFLKMLADKYGYYFAIRDNVLVFIRQVDLDTRPPYYELDIKDVKSYSFKSKSAKTYKAAKVKYKNPKDNKLVSAEIDWNNVLSEVSGAHDSGINQFISKWANKAAGFMFGESEYLPNINNGQIESYDVLNDGSDDILNIVERVENQQQAEALAHSKLYKSNKGEHTGRIETKGNPLLIAGNSILVSGFGNDSGKYIIVTSTHRKTRSGGYTCSIEISKTYTTVVGRKKSVKKSKK